MKRSESKEAGESASQLITKRIAELGGWRGEALGRIRALIKQADPDIVEEWKWQTPVWSHDGIVCTGEAYKTAVKMTFAKGASVADPSGLFNSSLDGNVRRAIDVREGEKLNEGALKALIRAAVDVNAASKAAPAKAKPATPTKAKQAAPAKAKAAATKAKPAAPTKAKPATPTKAKAKPAR